MLKNYFTNLIPQNKAVFATKNNIIYFEQQRVEFENKAQQLLAAAQERAAELTDIVLTIKALASAEGRLYGSIGLHEILTALNERAIVIDKREIILPASPIHSIGDFSVEIQLHHDVITKLQIQVVAI